MSRSSHNSTVSRALTRNVLLFGDCVSQLAALPPASVDFILTDPPYIVHYRARDGKTVANDDNERWLKPAFAGMYQALKPGGLCVSFYGWSKADRFIEAWRDAGFRIVGHLVFRKRYASAARFVRYEHEQAYLLAKGDAALPTSPIGDVIEWDYSGNRLHPTQKPVGALKPLIEAFCPKGGLVLDPFAGSGSTLIAARETGRAYAGIELDRAHYWTARRRLEAAAALTA